MNTNTLLFRYARRLVKDPGIAAAFTIEIIGTASQEQIKINKKEFHRMLRIRCHNYMRTRLLSMRHSYRQGNITVINLSQNP